MYEVVAANSNVHVYKIKDINSDKLMVVHRNLLLPVNFLPIDDGQETHTRGSSEVVPEVNSPEEVDHSGEVVPEVNLPDESDGSVDQTAHWVLASPGDFRMEDRQTRLSEAHDVSDCVSEPLESASDIRSDQRMQDSDVSPATNGPHDAEPQPVVTTQEDVATDALTVCTQPPGFENTAARTRQDRAINSAKRFICEMNEQVPDTPWSTVSSFVSLVKSLF